MYQIEISQLFKPTLIPPDEATTAAAQQTCDLVKTVTAFM